MKRISVPARFLSFFREKLMDPAVVKRVNDFFFGPEGSDSYGKNRKEWWVGTVLDEGFRTEFMDVWEGLIGNKYSMDEVCQQKNVWHFFSEL